MDTVDDERPDNGRAEKGGRMEEEWDMFDGEMEDILSGFERELLRTKTKPKRRILEPSLEKILETEDGQNDSCTTELATHIKSFAEKQEEMLSNLHKSLEELQEGREDVERRMKTEEGDKQGREEAERVVENSLSENCGKNDGETRSNGSNVANQDVATRSATSSSLELEGLKRRIEAMEFKGIEAEQKLMRQRSELSQMWRSAAHLGRQLATERAHVRSERIKVEKAEEALRKSQEAEEELRKKLAVAAEEASQLRVAFACVKESEAEVGVKKREKRSEEEELRRLREQNVELEALVSEASIRIDELEDEVATLKKSNKVLTAKVGWIATTNRKLEEELAELNEAALQKDATHALELEESHSLQSYIWELMDDFHKTSQVEMAESEEVTYLRCLMDCIHSQLLKAGSKKSNLKLREVDTGSYEEDEEDEDISFFQVSSPGSM